VDLFRFVSWCLVTTSAVTLIWPVNILFAALAYKVRHGSTPVAMLAREFWGRSTFAALGLAFLTVVILGLDYLLVASVKAPIGPVQLTLLMVYMAAAAGYLFWMFALDDILQAFSIFFLYILLPGFPLLLIGRFAHLWTRLMEKAPWLLPST
jgi:hypothetical protein